jgi:apolipoprotein N-acyltransferase
MLGIILPVVAFYIFASIFSGDRAASDGRWKIFILALVATLTLSAISRANPTPFGLAIAIVVTALLSFAGLIWWIKTSRSQALKITGSYLGFALAYSVIVATLFRFLMSRQS